MSLVVIPFRYENPELLVRNVGVAAAHPRVTKVLGVGFEEDRTFRTLLNERPAIEQATGTPVEVILQERIGKLRPGKGDAMNTALARFLAEEDSERIHFYDADIASFSPLWIDKAEEGADQGYDVVRHYFPRAATDAMITWMVTRVGFALLWPHTSLPWIEQPLGGELLLTRAAAEAIAADPAVAEASDWGIDTNITFSAVRQGMRMFEVYVPEGKVHKLYGRLSDLKLMLVECFAAIQRLRHVPVPESTVHRIEYPDVVPQEIMKKLGFDIEESMALLGVGWTERQVDLLELFPTAVLDGLAACRDYPRVGFMGEAAWTDSYRVLLERFVAGDPDWEELLFKLWSARVLNYTLHAVTRGYEYALQYLHAMIYRTLTEASRARRPR